MISEFFVLLGVGLATWMVGMFGTDWEVPAEVANFDNSVSEFIGQFTGLGVWAPWVLLIACAGVAVATWLICLGVKALRAVAAHIPFGFGGAG